MSIKTDILHDAINDAKRFIRAAEEALRNGKSMHGKKFIEGGALCASVKRSSMDLTKILARIRCGV